MSVLHPRPTSHGNRHDLRLLIPVTALKYITKVRLINSKQTPGRRGNNPSSSFSLPAVLPALRQHLNSTAAGNMGEKKKNPLQTPQPPKTCCTDEGGDNNGVTPPPYRDCKEKPSAAEKELGFVGSAQRLCLRRSVCVWPAGTGTADPPLTPGGVHRVVEED